MKTRSCVPSIVEAWALSALASGMVACFTCAVFAFAAEQSAPRGDADLRTPQLCEMPRVEDYTLMWWAEGFPAHTPEAPWTRCLQTGRYALALDTETLRISHLGPVPAGLGYTACARADNRAWQSLPAADLALTMTANGRPYRCTAGGKWTNFTGPRIIESGRFMQRADVTDLVFTATDGARLNVEARFETVAWPDRLALILAARPGRKPIPAGDACFGRIGGGFGLDGTNHLEIPHSPELDPERFTLEFWAFVPTDYQASERTFPWLVCKNHHEEAEGNYGLVLLNGVLQARINIGGGRENAFVVDAQRQPSLQLEAWNHLAMSYDGDTLRLYVNGAASGEKQIGRKRVPGRQGLAFGRRQDNCGDGYHFRGAVDEIRIYDQALTPAEVRERAAKPKVEHPSVKPVRAWSFRAEGRAALSKPAEDWRDAAMEVRLTTAQGVQHQRWELPAGETWGATDWHEVFVSLLPGTPQPQESARPVTVQAAEVPGGAARPVDYDAARGWHRVNLDGIVPVVPPGGPEKQNDAIERVQLVLTNPDTAEQTVRLLFEKNGSGIRLPIGSPITGVSAVLRDTVGNPTGIPVQLSKNWHARPEGGVYAGAWFHGFSQVRLPPGATVHLELSLAYGHWGGVAAASHAQLCLIGWGSNQLWDQSALGCWGESICYEPDQAQAQAAILDVRPVMVRSMNRNLSWNWTHNVGGGDFFRLFDSAGKRVFPGRMRTAYERQGPCLTEVTYAGHSGRTIEHAATVSLCRSDDVVRGTYRLRMDVKEASDFARFVIFQIGADTYGYTGERKLALGNETGLVRQWDTQWGGDTYRTQPMECTGRVPWISLHEAVSRAGQDEQGAWANRGLVIRSWDARLGGKQATPWVAERGVRARGADTSTVDLVPPPGITRLEPGDFVEATIEHIVMPQFAKDYYGPNEALRATLGQWENTWRMIHREATGNDRRVEIKAGELERLHPAVRMRAVDNRAEFTLRGGLGYVPITFTGLTSPRGQALYLDGKRLDQSVHGNDFWQTDYDPATQRWELTFNIPAGNSPVKLTLDTW
ncbi:MAG: LamG domain-containing protein [Planctomycetota bacterium]|nr:LamG domain-containing protein [Planctomycetota bacterium]